MVDFFEFKKKSSDGIRKKTPQFSHARAYPAKEVDNEKNQDIHVVSYTEHDENISPKEDVFGKNNEEMVMSVPEEVFLPASISEHKERASVHGHFIEKPPLLVSKNVLYPAIKHFSKAFHPRKNGDAAELSLPEEIKKDSTSRIFRWGVISGIAVLIVIGAFVSFRFSRLVITIKPALNSQELLSTQIFLDHTSSEINFNLHSIPAERLEFSRTEKEVFSATGQKIVEERARGIVRIYNRFGSSPQHLVAQTRLITDSGVLYRLSKAVTIPGAKIEEGKIIPRFIEAEVAADRPGQEANVSGEVTMKILGFLGTPKYEGFYALAEGGLHGGISGESHVATKEDIARAEEGVTKKVFDWIKHEMGKKISPDLTVIDGLREIEIIKLISPKEYAAGDTFEIEARAVGRLLVFRESDVATLLERIVGKEKKNSEKIENLREISYAVKNIDLKNGRAELSLTGKVFAKSIISPTELASLLRGMPKEDIFRILKGRGEIGDFSLALFPPWIFHAPEHTDRIRVIIDGG